MIDSCSGFAAECCAGSRYPSTAGVQQMWAGPDLLQVGPLFRKNVGPLIYEYPVTPLPPDTVGADMHSSHHRHFVEDPCCNAVTMLQKMKKNFLSFYGGPRSAEHAEHA